MSRRRRLPLAAFAGLCALAVCFAGTTDHGLWAPDEPRVASIEADLLAHAEWLVPHFLGKPFLEKPPLGFWPGAGCLALCGRSAGSARLASGLASASTLGLVFFLTQRLANVAAALRAALVLATTWGFFWYGHRILVDPWLVLAVAAGHGCATLAQTEAAASAGLRRPHPGWLLGAYASASLAFWVKGPVGPGMILGPGLLHALLLRRGWLLRSPWHLAGLGLLGAACAAWPLLLYARGGWGLVEPFLRDNVLYRLIEDPSGRVVLGHQGKPLYTYLLSGPPLLLPWLLLWPAAVLWPRRGALPPRWRREGLVFLAGLFPWGLLLLSIPATKRSLYLVPLIPSTAPLLGACLAARDRTRAQTALRSLDGAGAWLWFGPSLLLLTVLGAGLVLKSGLVPLRPHLEDLAHLVTPWTASALLAAALGLGVLGWRGARDSLLGRRAPGLRLALLYAAFATCGASLLFPLGESSFGRRSAMARELARMGALAPPGPLGLWLDESGLGSVAFETGVRLENYYGHGEDLEALLAAHPGRLVLARLRLLERLAPPRARRLLVPTGKRWYTGGKGDCALFRVVSEPR